MKISCLTHDFNTVPMAELKKYTQVPDRLVLDDVYIAIKELGFKYVEVDAPYAKRETAKRWCSSRYWNVLE